MVMCMPVYMCVCVCVCMCVGGSLSITDTSCLVKLCTVYLYSFVLEYACLLHVLACINWLIYTVSMSLDLLVHLMRPTRVVCRY